MPDHLRDISVSSAGGVELTSIGFGTPHPSRPHNRALQRQVSLLTGDKLADYFLFDELERPIRFAIHGTWAKISFRVLRSDAMFGATEGDRSSGRIFGQNDGGQTGVESGEDPGVNTTKTWLRKWQLGRSWGRSARAGQRQALRSSS